MAKKNVKGYVTYNLFWLPSMGGIQPHLQVRSMGLKADGTQQLNADLGLCMKDGKYYGYIRGTKTDIQAAVDACAAWNMKKISQSKMIQELTAIYGDSLEEPITVNPDGSLKIVIEETEIP